MSTEIKQMLQLSNLRSTSEKLNWVEKDLSEVLKQCLKEILPTAEARKVRFDVHLDPVTTIAVEDHLTMFFENLLSNAVNYSSEGGLINLRCERIGVGVAQVMIEDEGIGIHPEKLPRIFEEYFRTDEASQHNKGSTGLGLTIVEHIAKSHGIQIRVESEPGIGTRFKLIFRIKKNENTNGER
jgi:signal transduction histidine kinase